MEPRPPALGAGRLRHRTTEEVPGRWFLLRFNLVPQSVKNLPAMQETWVQSLGWEDPLEKEMATHSRILAGESHGQRSLAGYSPWGCKSQTLNYHQLVNRKCTILSSTQFTYVCTCDLGI